MQIYAGLFVKSKIFIPKYPQGDVTKRAKLLRDNGVFCGYLDIPGTAEAGQYLVRSYLRGMSDMDYAGKQIVYIHGRPSG